MPQQNYEIRVRGRLGETFRTAFPRLHARTQGNDTVLSGSLADRAALYGVLTMIETLGLELIEEARGQIEDWLTARAAMASYSSSRPGRVWLAHRGSRRGSSPYGEGRRIAANSSPAARRHPHSRHPCQQRRNHAVPAMTRRRPMQPFAAASLQEEPHPNPFTQSPAAGQRTAAGIACQVISWSRWAWVSRAATRS